MEAYPTPTPEPMAMEADAANESAAERQDAGDGPRAARCIIHQDSSSQSLISVQKRRFNFPPGEGRRMRKGGGVVQDGLEVGISWMSCLTHDSIVAASANQL